MHLFNGSNASNYLHPFRGPHKDSLLAQKHSPPRLPTQKLSHLCTAERFGQVIRQYLLRRGILEVNETALHLLLDESNLVLVVSGFLCIRLPDSK
jgi:hypothetical protein